MPEGVPRSGCGACPRKTAAATNPATTSATTPPTTAMVNLSIPQDISPPGLPRGGAVVPKAATDLADYELSRAASSALRRANWTQLAGVIDTRGWAAASVHERCRQAHRRP